MSGGVACHIQPLSSRTCFPSAKPHIPYPGAQGLQPFLRATSVPQSFITIPEIVPMLPSPSSFFCLVLPRCPTWGEDHSPSKLMASALPSACLKTSASTFLFFCGCHLDNYNLDISRHVIGILRGSEFSPVVKSV